MRVRYIFTGVAYIEVEDEGKVKDKWQEFKKEQNERNKDVFIALLSDAINEDTNERINLS